MPLPPNVEADVLNNINAIYERFEQGEIRDALHRISQHRVVAHHNWEASHQIDMKLAAMLFQREIDEAKFRASTAYLNALRGKTGSEDIGDNNAAIDIATATATT